MSPYDLPTTAAERVEARRALERMLEAHSREAAELSDEAMADLGPILAAARQELDRDLAAWLASGKAGERWTPQAYRQSILAIQGAEHTMKSILEDGLLSTLVHHDEIARALANSHTASELMAYARAGAIELNPTVPLKVASILNSGRHAPMARYETSAHRYAGQVGLDIRRHLAIGVVRGETTDQLVNRLVAHGGPRGLVALQGIAGQPGAITEVIPEGLFARYEYWADRIVRTELSAAYNEQVQDIANDLREDEFPEMRRQWDAAADRRTCARCGAMHGQVTDAKTDKFVDGVDVPLHPNCRCRAGLWMPGWSRFLGHGPEGAPGPLPDLPTPLSPEAAAAEDAAQVAAAEKAAAKAVEKAAAREVSHAFTSLGQFAAERAAERAAEQATAEEIARAFTSLGEFAESSAAEQATAEEIGKAFASLGEFAEAAEARAVAEAAKAAAEAAKLAAAAAKAAAAKAKKHAYMVGYNAKVKAQKAATKAAKLAAKAAPHPAPVHAPHAPPAPVAAPVHAVASSDPLGGLSGHEIMHVQEGAQRGSNQGGFYRGTDGVLRYVKKYTDPVQAHNEHLANNIYRELGHHAPRSGVFEMGGETYYTSVIEQGVQPLGTSAAEAQEVLRGFVSDVLTGNWDAVGPKFDNVMRMPDGRMIRIDTGGSLLFRGLQGRKPLGVLDSITELEKFFDRGINSQYAEVAGRAGVASIHDMRAEFLRQVDELVAVRHRLGPDGWRGFVQRVAPKLSATDAGRITRMLEERTRLLEARAQQLRAQAAAVPRARRTDIPGWRAPQVQGVAPHSTLDIASLPVARPPVSAGVDVLPSGETKAAFNRRQVAGWRAVPADDVRGLKKFTGNSSSGIRSAEREVALGIAPGPHSYSSAYIPESDAATRALEHPRAPRAQHTGWRGIHSVPRAAAEALIRSEGEIGMNVDLLGGTTSFSWRRDIADRFMGGTGDPTDGTFKVLFQMDSKSARAVGSVSLHATEEEIVAARTTRFRVLSVARWEGRNNILIVEIEEAP